MHKCLYVCVCGCMCVCIIYIYIIFIYLCVCIYAYTYISRTCLSSWVSYIFSRAATGSVVRLTDVGLRSSGLRGQCQDLTNGNEWSQKAVCLSVFGVCPQLSALKLQAISRISVLTFGLGTYALRVYFHAGCSGVGFGTESLGHPSL